MNPRDTLSPREIAFQLAACAFPEWLVFKGEPIRNLQVDQLLKTDQDFQMFYIGRLAEEIHLFERILAEADFLDQLVVDFFGIRGPMMEKHDTYTIRQWVQRRLISVRAKLNELLS